jgi:hypothetical protein
MVCYSVLRCVTVCYGVLGCDLVIYGVLQCVTSCYGVLCHVIACYVSGMGCWYGCWYVVLVCGVGIRCWYTVLVYGVGIWCLQSKLNLLQPTTQKYDLFHLSFSSSWGAKSHSSKKQTSKITKPIFS